MKLFRNIGMSRLSLVLFGVNLVLMISLLAPALAAAVQGENAGLQKPMGTIPPPQGVSPRPRVAFERRVVDATVAIKRA
jgi:hypothetical protein